MQVLSIDDILNATEGELISGNPDELIKEITTDSRKSGEGVLFVPLMGEKVDGHSFIDSALERGAISLSQYDKDYKGTVIKVRDTKKALGDIARYYKLKYPVRTVGITGSVGKTTTKDMIYAVMNEEFCSHKTPNNYNNDIGVPLTIFGIEEEHSAAVIEMGMNHFGEISYLTSIVKPECAVITNVGMSHIENLGSREGIFRAKMEITEGFTKANTLIVNGDNEYLRKIEDTEYKVIKFGMNRANDVYAKDIVNNGLLGVEFTAVYDGGEIHIEVSQPGVHNVYNALSAVCVGLALEIEPEKIAMGLRNCQYTASRLEIIRCGDIEIINDCYNSSPDSVRAAFKVMAETNKESKVAILGDNLEMGDFAIKAHYELGKDAVDSGITMLITAGEFAEEIARGARDNGLGAVVSYKTTDELCQRVTELVPKNSCVLIKASHGMNFYKITDALKSL